MLEDLTPLAAMKLASLKLSECHNVFNLAPLKSSRYELAGSSIVRFCRDENVSQPSSFLWRTMLKRKIDAKMATKEMKKGLPDWMSRK